VRKVIYSMFASVDGYIEDSTGSLGWVLVDEELHRYVNDQETESDTYLYGRRLYENMAAYWPTAEHDPNKTDYTVEYARIWNAMPKVVFSKTLQHVEHNARLVREDIAGEVARLKAQPGKNLALGGPDLAETFFRLGLVDEVQIYIHPVILGGGKSMFRTHERMMNLHLVRTYTFRSGVIHLCYETVRSG
jgi:dihydrofolate reductase